MDDKVVLSKDDILSLHHFHEIHFPGQDVPALEHSSAPNVTVTQDPQINQEDDLGLYEDGVRRTLTDDQIAMFRNSEIQRIVQERRNLADKEKQRKNKRKKTRESADPQPNGKKTWTKHFDEAPQSIETLMYDDLGTTPVPPEHGPKQFMWPKLG